MNFITQYSKESIKYLETSSEKERRKIIQKINDFNDWLFGKSINIDVKKLKGKWKGFYRIRTGKIRIIISVDIENELIQIINIGKRGNIY